MYWYIWLKYLYLVGEEKMLTPFQYRSDGLQRKEHHDVTSVLFQFSSLLQREESWHSWEFGFLEMDHLSFFFFANVFISHVCNYINTEVTVIAWNVVSFQSFISESQGAQVET